MKVMNPYSTTRSGFTLVELLIALLLSSIVIGAGFALFINSNRVYQSSAQTSVIQQSARAALDIMASEIKMAGLGTMAQQIIDTQVIQPQQREAEIGVTQNTTNNTNAPDTFQFKASLGGMTLVIQEAPVSTLTCVGENCGAAMHPGMGSDHLMPNMWVDIMDLNRVRLFSGKIVEFNMELDPPRVFFASPLTPGPTGDNPGVLQVGTVILQQPMYVTYTVIGDKLVRCATRTWPATCNLDDTSLFNRVPTVDEPMPDTNYYLTSGVRDLQFTYHFAPDPTNETLPSGWLPTASQSIDMSYANRSRITAVKIEILMESEHQDPVKATENCDNTKSNFYLGDRHITITDCSHKYFQMSTIVYMPNLDQSDTNAATGS